MLVFRRSIIFVYVPSNFDYTKVLFIPGIYNEKEYNNTDSAASIYYHKSQIEQAIAASEETNVDFVFSAEWALGFVSSFLSLLSIRMLRNLDSSRFPSIPDCHSVGSPIISRVLVSVRPRYHFAGSMVSTHRLFDLEHILRACSLSQHRWHHYAHCLSGPRPRWLR